MPKFYKSKRLWGMVFASAFLALCFYDIDLGQLWGIIRGIDLRILLVAVFCQLLLPVWKALRWKFILDPVKKIKFRDMFSVYCVGWLLNVSLPMLTGQVARTFLLSKKHQIGKTKSFASVALEVVFDGSSLLALMTALSFFFAFPQWLIRGQHTLALLLGIGVVLLYLLILNPKFITRIKEKFPHKITAALEKFLQSFSDGLQILRSSRHIVIVSALSLLAWFTQVIVVTLLIVAFGFKLPVWGAVVVVVINTLMMMFPLTPANLGTFQVATILGLTFFGISKTEALSLGLLLHALDIIPSFALGIFFMLFEKSLVKRAEPKPASGA
ncbi:MAG: flippase-like domain-containing protein [candidate division Zixibacteria bacterium]|nr:flippase-like domain-containing protein [candidate division Zixibacteria bacterium]